LHLSSIYCILQLLKPTSLKTTSSRRSPPAPAPAVIAQDDRVELEEARIPLPNAPRAVRPAKPASALAILENMPTLTADEQRALSASYINSLHILGEQALQVIESAMYSCDKPIDSAKIAFQILDRIGIVPKTPLQGAGSGSGEKIAASAVQAAILGMAKIAGIDESAFKIALKNRPLVLDAEDVTSSIEEEHDGSSEDVLESIGGNT
jgi:hypothetical protein